MGPGDDQADAQPRGLDRLLHRHRHGGVHSDALDDRRRFPRVPRGLYRPTQAGVQGSPLTSRDVAARIAAASGTSALVPTYRLCPENPLAASLEDALTAYRWLVREVGSADQIVVGGDSAGGGLALRLLGALRDAGDP